MTSNQGLAGWQPATFVLTAVVVVVIGTHALSGQETSPPDRATSRSLVEALDNIPRRAQPWTFAGGDLDLPRGGHLQGIQACFDPRHERHLVLLSHDSATVGYLAVVEFPAGLSTGGRIVHVHTFPSDGQSPPLRHAGGFQLAGSVLAIGLEDNQQKTRSQVQFWDMSAPAIPTQLTHLTIRRAGMPEEKTAGAVGLIARAKDYLVAVANWDSRAIDFYTTNGTPITDAACRFELRARFQASAADKAAWKPDRFFAEYQAVNLIDDALGQTFLVGFATNQLGQDVADLFAVELDGPPEKMLRKVARKTMTLTDGNHFRYAGGVWIDARRMALLSAPRNFSRQTQLNVAR